MLAAETVQTLILRPSRVVILHGMSGVSAQTEQDGLTRAGAVLPVVGEPEPDTSPCSHGALQYLIFSRCLCPFHVSRVAAPQTNRKIHRGGHHVARVGGIDRSSILPECGALVGWR